MELCYCVPEFNNLDVSQLPEADDLLQQLAAKLDCPMYSTNR